ncbi:MAG: hypothetical protein AAGF01_17065 [Cyanobacteria bacterium P01_G01_bin.38]
MSQKQILIHIGYHKTGSTFLQDLVFSSEEYGFSSPWDVKEYFENIISVNPFAYRSSQTRSFFIAKIESAWTRSLVPVLSCEALSGDPWKRGCNSGFNNKLAADRLAEAFPEGRILIVIRAQASMIFSLYRHSIRSFWSMSIEDYLEQSGGDKGLHYFDPLFRLEYLEYNWLIEYYQKLFGQENVLVLPYEGLKLRNSDFLEKLENFTNTHLPRSLNQTTVNQGYSGLSVALKRWTNKLSPTCAQPNETRYQKFNNSVFYQINKITPKWIGEIFDRRLRNSIESQIKGRYKESNRITAQLTGLDLQAYGYEI